MTAQPVWKFVANLGDASPIDYGGLFLYEDETGVYPPELEKLERDNDRDDSDFIIHRVTLDKLKQVQGERGKPYLVTILYEPNWTHPLPSYEEWFAKDLAGVAATMGTTEAELRAAFCGDDSKARARAYQCVYDHHGWENGDSYPLHLNLDEIEDRYKRDEIDKRDPLDRLRDALSAEHVADCGDTNTCDIDKAHELELYLWAGRLLTGATECPRTTAALNAIAPTEAQLSEECKKLLEEPHLTCGECNAIVWTDEDSDVCDSCGAAVVKRTIKIENRDDDETTAMLSVSGPGALKWAKDQQSILGSMWEGSDGDDFAYAIVVDRPDIADEIRKEVGDEVEIDDGEYCPPD